EDLIAQGFSDEALAERLKRQHKLICAAIHSGRINDLKKMSGKVRVPLASDAQIEKGIDDQEVVDAPEVEASEAVVQEFEIESVEEFQPAVEEFEIEYGPITQEWTPPPPRVEEEVAEEEYSSEQPEAEEVIPDAEEEAELPQGFEEPQADGLVIT